jgi:hypothetical protein
MSDTTTHLGLPYLLAAQAQKHVTHNEALRLLDAMVQLSVLDRTRTAPPANPGNGDRHLVASGATGAWAGWDLNIAYRIDGAWMRLVPRVGWQVWVADEGVPLVWTGSAWQDVADRPLQGLKVANGTAAAPSLSFSADPDTGLYRAGADALGISAGGAERARVTSSGLQVTGQITGTAVTQSATDTTAGRLLTTGAGPAQAFRRGNILGAVSQSGGVPTGAMIESGSNSNGEYVRLANGTQICTHAVSASLAIDTAFMGGFRSAAQTWTFPAAFSAAPNFTPVARNLTAFGAVSANVPGTTSATYAVTAVSSQSAATREVLLHAVGRWF